MSLPHNAPLSDRLVYGETVSPDLLIDALLRLEALDCVLENFNLDTDPEGLEKELADLLPDE